MRVAVAAPATSSLLVISRLRCRPPRRLPRNGTFKHVSYSRSSMNGPPPGRDLPSAVALRGKEEEGVARDADMQEAIQPVAVRRTWGLYSGTCTRFILSLTAAADAMQTIPSKALAQSYNVTITHATFTADGPSTASHYFQRLVLMDLDPATAKLAISIVGPLLSAYGFLFIIRIVMSWYPKLPVGKFPYVLAYAPTEPLLILTRKLIPPLGGVDVTPVVWFGLISFLNEILVGPQGLLVLLSQQV